MTGEEAHHIGSSECQGRDCRVPPRSTRGTERKGGAGLLAISREANDKRYLWDSAWDSPGHRGTYKEPRTTVTLVARLVYKSLCSSFDWQRLAQPPPEARLAASHCRPSLRNINKLLLGKNGVWAGIPGTRSLSSSSASCLSPHSRRFSPSSTQRMVIRPYLMMLECRARRAGW
jgi:hypothetical protein